MLDHTAAQDLDLETRLEGEAEARLDHLERERTRRADTLPGSYAVTAPAPTEGQARHEGTRRTGARRDRAFAELRQEYTASKARITELESTLLVMGQALLTQTDRLTVLEHFVDETSAVFAALRRHTQFHTDDVPGCGVCHPTDAERATDRTVRSYAQASEIKEMHTSPSEG